MPGHRSKGCLRSGSKGPQKKITTKYRGKRYVRSVQFATTQGVTHSNPSQSSVRVVALKGSARRCRRPGEDGGVRGKTGEAEHDINRTKGHFGQRRRTANFRGGSTHMSGRIVSIDESVLKEADEPT